MKYKYYDQRGRLLCTSDAPIEFNLFLYPPFKYIKCVTEGKEDKVIAARIIPSEEDKAEAVASSKSTVKKRSTPVKKKSKPKVKEVYKKDEV